MAYIAVAEDFNTQANISLCSSNTKHDVHTTIPARLMQNVAVEVSRVLNLRPRGTLSLQRVSRLLFFPLVLAGRVLHFRAVKS